MTVTYSAKEKNLLALQPLVYCTGVCPASCPWPAGEKGNSLHVRSHVKKIVLLSNKLVMNKH